MKPTKYNNTDEYTHMSVMGVEGVYSPIRIEEETLPQGFYRYALTPGKDQRFASIHKAEKNTYAGDFIAKEELKLGFRAEKKLREKDWTLDEERSFDFQGFWGQKLSLDKQISNAKDKRAAMMDPDFKNRQKNEPARDDHEMIDLN